MLLDVHVCVTWYLVGLSWFVQMVHYPLLYRIPDTQFSDYCKRHQKLTGRVVIVPMLVEFISGIMLWHTQPSDPWLSALMALLAIVWGVTFFIAVPAHQALARAKSTGVIRRLILAHWVRTSAWTLRGILLLLLLIERG